MNPRSQTIIRIPASRKGRYCKAARDQGRTIADWAIRELDRASGYDDPEVLYRLETSLPLAGRACQFTLKEWKRIFGYDNETLA